MSDNHLTVIVSDPHRRPGSRDAADGARAVLSGMLPDDDDDARRGPEAMWRGGVEVVFRGANLARISCPHCGVERGHGRWW
ncbi:hypothetical protein [Streptomyces sp. NPDC026673]|uniref:hypothetical protein n=1 Tax=Streptomyces sp. NPDC026673 TaxID=3155724 RepID=UPI0033F0CAFE